MCLIHSVSQQSISWKGSCLRGAPLALMALVACLATPGCSVVRHAVGAYKDSLAQQERERNIAELNAKNERERILSERMQEEQALKEGEMIAGRLEAECDYWSIVKYNDDGTVSIKKAVYGDWGGVPSMFLPYEKWEGLTLNQQHKLTQYLSKKTGIKQIYLGSIKPSDSYDRNTITVDKVAWSKG